MLKPIGIILGCLAATIGGNALAWIAYEIHAGSEPLLMIIMVIVTALPAGYFAGNWAHRAYDRIHL